MKDIYKPERRYFNAEISLEKREEGQSSRSITLRAAVTNKNSKRLAWGFVERIEPGAFDGADLTDVVACLNHDKNILYARTTSGTLKLSTDAEGLLGSFDAPETTHGNDLLVMVARGDINKASFEFTVDKDRWVNDPDLGEVRVIEKFRKIYDISPVVFEAYPDTDVAQRSKQEYEAQNTPPEKKVPASVMHAEAEYQYIKIKNNH
jgi:HK97 family phage prohead protease